MAAVGDRAVLQFRTAIRPMPPMADQRFVAARSAKAAHLRARSDLAALRMRLAYLVLEEKANYDESQPRWPKGSGDISGRWSGGSDSYLSSERVRVAGRGHHYVPQSVFRDAKLNLPAETQRVLDRFVTGPVGQGGHNYTTDHRQYNEVVRDRFERFLQEQNIQSSRMTPAQAMSFGLDLLRSKDPRISEFNRRVLQRRLFFLITRIPFRGHE